MSSVNMQELLEKLERKPGSHKGENGRVAVIAGSVDYTGAPAIASRAALRTGCDLVKLLVPEAISDVVASYSENFIVESYQGNYFGSQTLEAAEEFAEWSDALVVGPGLGQPEEEALQQLLSGVEVPAVVDADAIGPGCLVEPGNLVFTPHSSEAEEIEEERGSLSEFAEKGAVILQKGPVDQVYSGEKYRNRTGTPAMTVGGTGDALSGVVASLLSRGLNRTDAARLGAWINGRAGELAADEYGNGMLATDLVERIPDAIR
ncbi:MAG: NAD(P)H-hydrate dehydratase [Candidatus Nanohaloarchaea archaeon]